MRNIADFFKHRVPCPPWNPPASTDLDSIAREALAVYFGSMKDNKEWGWYPTELVAAYQWSGGGKIPGSVYTIIGKREYAGDTPAVGSLMIVFSPDMARIEVTITKFGYFPLKMHVGDVDFLIPETIPPLGPDRLFMAGWVQSAPVYRWEEWRKQRRG